MLMDIIKSRHSIRKYTDEQISREDLEKILEAGNYAPNAGGGQRSMMVALHNKEQPSVIDDPTMKDGFYGAPTVIAIFSQGNFLFKTADAFCMAENIVLQATELGIASCIISRGEETFDGEEGRTLMKEWGVPDNYICQGFVVLGYIDGQQPVSKPRKPGRVQIIE